MPHPVLKLVAKVLHPALCQCLPGARLHIRQQLLGQIQMLPSQCLHARLCIKFRHARERVHARACSSSWVTKSSSRDRPGMPHSSALVQTCCCSSQTCRGDQAA